MILLAGFTVSESAVVEEPYHLGVALGLSGTGAPYSKEAVEGIEIAVNEINARGGFLGKHRIRLFVRDTQTQPEAAKQVVSDLISNDGVRAVIATYSSATSLAVKPICRENRVHQIETISNSENITKLDPSPYTYSVVPNTYMLSKTVVVGVAKLAKKNNWTQYATIASDYAWGRSSQEVQIDLLRQVAPELKLLSTYWPRLSQFEPISYIETIEREKVTHIMVVPAQIIAMLNAPNFSYDTLKSLEMILSLGAPLHREHKEELNKKLPGRFYELYGLTEGFVTVLDKNDYAAKPDSVGVPPPFFEMKIADQNGKEVPTGEVGEICGRGPVLMPEYYKRPDLTEEAIKDGWLHSGDMGYVDEDGFLYLVDRKKDMIISGGVNVYPRDIEEIVVQHPAIQEVAVFGIASLGGILFAVWLRFVDPESALGVFSMVDYLLMVIIGGLGTLYGSIIGATFFMATQAWLPDLLKSIAALFPDYEIIHRIAERWIAFLGLMFIVAIMVFPKGVVGTARDMLARRRKN